MVFPIGIGIPSCCTRAVFVRRVRVPNPTRIASSGMIIFATQPPLCTIRSSTSSSGVRLQFGARVPTGYICQILATATSIIVGHAVLNVHRHMDQGQHKFVDQALVLTQSLATSMGGAILSELRSELSKGLRWFQTKLCFEQSGALRKTYIHIYIYKYIYVYI